MPHIDLLQLPWFASIPLGDVVSLIDAMAPQQFFANEVVVMAGDVPAQLVVATAGEATLGASPADAKRVVAPCAFPVAAFFARTPAPEQIAAHSKLSVFLLAHERFESLLAQRHPAIAPFLRNLLASQAGLQPCRCVG